MSVDDSPRKGKNEFEKEREPEFGDSPQVYCPCCTQRMSEVQARAFHYDICRRMQALKNGKIVPFPYWWPKDLVAELEEPEPKHRDRPAETKPEPA